MTTAAGTPTAPPPEALIGQELAGRYKVGRIVGAGGMAVVYEAQCLSPLRRCAIKVILPEAIKSDGTTVERFRREAAIARKLQNPHVVEFLDYGKVADGRPYLVMEYLEGDDLLNRLLLKGPLNFAASLKIMEGVCSALATAHGLAITHRDLKPSNIFLAKAETGGGEVVKLLDFGASKLDRRSLSQLTSRGLVIGTAEYMSPEQARGGDIDPRSDIFSLGIVLFEMLTGKRPFEAHRQIDVLFLIVGAPTPSVEAVAPNLPKGIDAVLGKAMAKKVAERYQSVGELLDGLRALAPGASTDAPAHLPSPAPLRPNTAERKRRLKNRTGLASAVLADDRNREDRLSEPLIMLGLVTAGAVEDARRDQKERGGELSEALLRIQAITDVVLLRTFATRYGARYVRSDKVEKLKPPPELLAKVPYVLASKLMVLPFAWEPPNGDVEVLAAVPVEPGVDQAIREATGAAAVRLVLTTPSVLEDAHRRWYPKEAPPKPKAEEYIPPGAAGEKKKTRPSKSKQKAVEIPPTDEMTPDEPTAIEPLPAVTEPPPPPSPSAASARPPSITASTPVTPAARPPSAASGVPAARPPTVGQLRPVVPTTPALPPSGASPAAAPPSPPASPTGAFDGAKAVPQVAKLTFALLDEVLSADRCAILLESGTLLTSHPKYASPDAIPPNIVSQAKGMSGGLLIGEASDDYRFQSATGPLVKDVRTAMCLPLRYEGRELGLLFAGSTRGNPFRAGDLQRLVLMADQLSLGLSLAQPGPGSRAAADASALPSEPVTLEAAVLWVEVPELALMAAKRPAAQVLKAVNQLFEDVSAAISGSGGKVERHLGHGVVGIFSSEHAARNAIEAGRRALSCGTTFTLGGAPVVLRLGVHAGPLVVGRVGMGRRFMESALGPVLYIASRLGALEPGRLVVSQAALDQAQLGSPPGADPLPALELELETSVPASSLAVEAAPAAFTVELG